MSVIVINKGREKPIIQQHPWIFSGAIKRVEGEPAAGDIVTVVSQDNKFLARGYWNARSQIQVRILTWKDEEINDDWWRAQLQRAIENRKTMGLSASSAYRLVNAENDYLPGLVVDRYGDWLVLQALTFAIDRRKHQLAEMLAQLTGVKGIFERSDVDVRGKEGLKPEIGVLWGEEPPPTLTIEEGGVKMLVDVRKGHKTGTYLDQSENRKFIQQFLSGEFDGFCRFLNLFSYTGGFSAHALLTGGVHAVSVDTSHDVLALAEENFKLNGLDQNQHAQTYELIQADVFEYLRDIADEGQQFDVVILDPPKFAHNQQQIEKAARGYKDINLNAFKVIKPGGYLFTFSCSGAISRDLFQKIVFGALADAGRQAQIVRHLSAAPDHPVALTFPEGEYLKGLMLKVY